MAYLVGAWTADNAAYQSDDEPFDAYRLEWTREAGGGFLQGRLFGLREGERVGPFWTFVQFWHPGEQRLVVQQFGAGGVVGLGAVEPDGEHVTRLVQTLWAPDGSPSQTGHRTERLGPDAHQGRSFAIGADGVWTPQRSYRWERVPDDGP